MEVVDFVIENYIWFILGGIVILMVLIGYFAEKTQFGKKNSEKKQKHKEPKRPKKNSKIELEEKLKKQEVDTQFEESIEVPIEEEPIDESTETPVEEVEEESVEDTNEPMEDLDAIEIREPEMEEEKMSATEELLKEIDDEIPEDLYAGLDGTPNAYKVEKEDTTPVEDLDLELPNIDALKDDVEGISAEEDNIWRF